MRDKMTYLIIGGFLLGYFFCSIPSGLWLVQVINGIDIRFYGNSVGTSAVYRVAGPKMAFAAFMADLLKGVVPLALMSCFTDNSIVLAVTALGSFLGHRYSVFLGFRHRKGVVAGFGPFLFLLPVGAAAGICAGMLALIFTRNMIAGWMAAYLVAVLTGWLLQYPLPIVLYGVFAVFFALIRFIDVFSKCLGYQRTYDGK